MPRDSQHGGHETMEIPQEALSTLCFAECVSSAPLSSFALGTVPVQDLMPTIVQSQVVAEGDRPLQAHATAAASPTEA